MNSLSFPRRDSSFSSDRFSPPVVKSNGTRVREFLQQNCKTINVRSIAVGSSSYLFTALALISYKNAPMTSLVFSISAIATTILWHKWGNTPILLARVAWEAISKQDEATALGAIRAGANIEATNIEVGSGVSIFRIPTLPFFPSLTFSMSTPVINMFVHAAENNCTNVIDLLLAVKRHDNKSLLTALALTDTLEIVQKLVAHADPLNQETGEYSPMALQIMRSCRGGANFQILENSLAIIEFLLNSGARFNSKDLPKEKLISTLYNFMTSSLTLVSHEIVKI